MPPNLCSFRVELINILAHANYAIVVKSTNVNMVNDLKTIHIERSLLLNPFTSQVLPIYPSDISDVLVAI